MDISKIIEIMKFVSRLKKEKRAGWNKKNQKGEIINQVEEAESVADHSYGLIILCLIIGMMRKLNLRRLLTMAILHDLPEAVDGDQITADIKDQKVREEKEAIKKVREYKSLELIFSDLPFEMKQYLLSVFKEYQDNFTPEAQLVNQLDKIETITQAFDYREAGNTVQAEEFLRSYQDRITDPELIKLLEAIKAR